jgi:hypothetical protein
VSSRAAEYLAQYETKIGKVGQWIAIRRFAGTTVKTYSDTLTRAYLTYYPVKEFVGAVVQGELVAIALVNSLGAVLPVTTNDKLVTEFYGFADAFATPQLTVDSHVSGGKQTSITSAVKRTTGGVLIALELHAVG